MTKVLKDQIISVLVSERKRQGLTQGELAFRAGMDVSFVSKIERGIGDRAISTFQRLADALQMDYKIELVAKSKEE